MALYTFTPFLVVDAQFQPAVGATGQVYALSDTLFSSPLATTDLNGLTVTLTTNSAGYVPAFRADVGEPSVVWKSSDGQSAPMMSIEGVLAVAADASASAASASESATTAQLAAEAAASSADGAVRTVNGIEPDSSGNVNVSGGGGGGGTVNSVNSKGPDGSGNVVLVPGDVGAAAASHNHAASAITSGTIAAARLGSGSPSSTNFLRGDGTWAVPSGGGGGTGSVDSVNGQGPDGSGNVTLTKAHIGLAAVDNTADAAKPVSTPQAAAIAAKANDSDVVKLSGSQTVAGVKTFSSSPVVPDGSFTVAKTSGLQAALDAKLTGTGIGAVVKITQAAYDALGSKDSSTLYVIVG